MMIMMMMSSMQFTQFTEYSVQHVVYVVYRVWCTSCSVFSVQSTVFFIFFSKMQRFSNFFLSISFIFTLEPSPRSGAPLSATVATFCRPPPKSSAKKPDPFWSIRSKYELSTQFCLKANLLLEKSIKLRQL